MFQVYIVAPVHASLAFRDYRLPDGCVPLVRMCVLVFVCDPRRFANDCKTFGLAYKTKQHSPTVRCPHPVALLQPVRCCET